LHAKTPNFGIFCSYLVDGAAVLHILLSSGAFFPILVYCTKENMATLLPDGMLVNQKSLF
jgi:hypothetical protein